MASQYQYMSRPKKLSFLSKEQIEQIITELVNERHITISNLCVLELKPSKKKEYFNVHTRKMEKAPAWRITIRKAKALNEELSKHKITW